MVVHSNSSSDSGHRRPKGILKRKSDQHMAGQAAIAAASSASAINSTPLPLTTSNIKELTLQNTSKNAGKRRGSSVSRSAASRKLSTPGANGSSIVEQQQQPHTPPEVVASHLTWDEANLILHEQNKVPRMKIDEPKTPFAPHYIPDEDEDMLMEGDIPSLDIGEAEQQQSQQGGNWISGFSLGGGVASIDRIDESVDLVPPTERRLSSSSHGSEKHVGVDPKDASPTHDAEREPQSEDEKRKHDMFEKKRKQHYEMSGIKNLLGKSIDIEDDEDDDDDDDVKNGGIDGNDDNDIDDGDENDGDENDSNDQDGDVDMDSGSRLKRVPPPIPPIPEQYKTSRR
ncbi:hypothetical protein KEM54_005921 [Ascosphaera aggregata]|nr:hypothetical protein KEM54_005921 [Ascosphaera aggregata]